MRTFLFILVCFSQLKSQSFQPNLAEAQILFDRKNYAAAVKHYDALIRSQKANGNTYYKAGVCYLYSRTLKHKAAPLLEKALAESTSFYTHGISKESDAPMDVYYQLAEAYRWQFKFEEAAQQYTKYKIRLQESKLITDVLEKELEEKIQASRIEAQMKDALALPPNIKLAGLFDPEKPIGEFSSSLSADKNTLIYTIKVPVAAIRKTGDHLHYETIPESETKSGEKTDRLPKLKLQQDTVINISTIGTSADGQVTITYRNDDGEARLYSQRLSGNDWSPPLQIDKTINTAGWEPDEYLSADGKELYFVSDRTGGYGGKDIYRCKMTKDGIWSKAENLGPEINSRFDDEAPFLHAGGKTLSFSSNRFHPEHAFDVLKTTNTDGKWNKPSVYGYPVNSNEKNLFYQVNIEKTKLIASGSASKTAEPTVKKETLKDISDSLSEKTDKWRDNYILEFDHEENGKSRILRSKINGGSSKINKPVRARLLIVDMADGSVLQSLLTDPKGQFSIIIPEKNCLLIYENDNYLPQTESYFFDGKSRVFKKHETVLLQPVEKGSQIELSSVRYNNAELKPDKYALSELDYYCKYLKARKEIKFTLHSELISSDKKNKSLVKERVKELKQIFVNSGIDEKRIKTKYSFKKQKQNKNTTKTIADQQKSSLLIDEN